MTTNTEPIGKDANPSLFSWAWVKSMFKALNFRKYTAEMWGSYHLSSLMTYASVFGFWKPLFSWISINAPWVATSLKFIGSVLIGSIKWVWAVILAIVATATG